MPRRSEGGRRGDIGERANSERMGGEGGNDREGRIEKMEGRRRVKSIWGCRKERRAGWTRGRSWEGLIVREGL